MGIFNRNQDRSQFEFEDSFAKKDQRPESGPPPVGGQGSNPTSSRQPPNTGNMAANRAKRAKITYSIEDAIKLMRELPSDQREMVVSIVQKTLSSANISVNDIIEDASRKLNRLGTRTKQLSKEIEELEAGIAERRTEIEKITIDTEETETVKISFENVLSTESADREERSARKSSSSSEAAG
ncbi:hypothetical protein [Pseudobacteriovorax antillogorgiicola]|uniref:Uncharacterized protein n=1 Tax=Pseudobacteriovorax antillogorgiicola TaxID=1513793 RepID=A0A1Y6CC55_9BACT|nr:hypothetical protein [Pseudobacteriovorax antillogorgiicola]TCS48331.1 hypothetical protein EDD56_118111 [Pseudobacteriovorax antillogorgiicola]SMF56482.1 hypothetical protein SAMN06296036_11830 [Pseudobacteriovorax antillogorgiicola]